MLSEQLCGNTSYGCIFCKTGSEHTLAQELSQDMLDIDFLVAEKQNRRRINGKMTTETVIMFPGYVFFRSTSKIDPTKLERNPLTLKLLTYDDERWQLVGDDYLFVRWLFMQGGIIGFSKARIEDNRLVFLNGPLMGQEKNIIKINRRFQNCLVSLVFENRKNKIWLGYELETEGEVLQDI